MSATGKGVNFSNAIVQDSEFFKAELPSGKFNRAKLERCNFRDVIFRDADFREAKLNGSTFQDALFEGARFLGANCLGADFRGANLKGAKEFSPEMLAQSRTDQKTILPNGAPGPYFKGSGSERPSLG